MLNAWLKQEKGSTPAGDDYYTKTLNYKIGKIDPKTVKPPKPKIPTDAPAMFFRSREEIIEGPPVMSGQQWKDFLKRSVEYDDPRNDGHFTWTVA